MSVWYVLFLTNLMLQHQTWQMYNGVHEPAVLPYLLIISDFGLRLLASRIHLSSFLQSLKWSDVDSDILVCFSILEFFFVYTGLVLVCYFFTKIWQHKWCSYLFPCYFLLHEVEYCTQSWCQWLLFPNIFQSILFCVQQKRRNPSSLEPLK